MMNMNLVVMLMMMFMLMLNLVMNDNDVEIEPAVDLDNPQSKNQCYDKRDFVARKHGKEREPWVQKPMPFPPEPSKKKDDEDFEHFC